MSALIPHIRALVWIAGTGLLLAVLHVLLSRPIVEPAISPASGAHADHTPRHGGVFFMAPDGLHHLEGTLHAGEFRIYFYDNFTQPLDARAFRARVGTRGLNAVPSGEYLTLQIDDLRSTPPHITAFIRFGNNAREDLFDFVFFDHLPQGR